MPNWVSNIVRGGCPKALRQLRDFSLIIPEHPSMSLFPDWASQHAVQLFQQGKNWQEVATDASFLAHLAREQEDTPTKCRLTPERAARRYCLYYKLHGYVDWYDWCCEHWGTKWNAHQYSHECGEVWFETAWSHPYPVIAALSRQFPAEVFSVSYADEELPTARARLLSSPFFIGAAKKITSCATAAITTATMTATVLRRHHP